MGKTREWLKAPLWAGILVALSIGFMIGAIVTSGTGDNTEQLQSDLSTALADAEAAEEALFEAEARIETLEAKNSALAEQMADLIVELRNARTK